MTLLPLTLLLLGAAASGHVLLQVPIGREVSLAPSDLGLPNTTAPGELCQVQVAAYEPITLRAGVLEPQVFYCDFDVGVVRYSHWGSPLLREDQAVLEVYRVRQNLTTTDRITVVFQVVNTSYDVVTVLRPLEVEDVLSGPIDDSVLQFRRLGGVCKARISRGLWPQRGKLVAGPELKRVDVIKRKCGDFLRLGLAYKHALPSTPDLDYIQISVEVSDPQLNRGEMFTETVHLPVVLRRCHANLPPQTSFSSQHLLEVDQFVLTTVTPAVLQATDSETPAEQLVYNLTQPFPPGQGHLVRLNNPSRLVLSFTQEELSGYNIAYQPPSRPVAQLEVFEARLTIYDSYFTPSEPVALHVALRPTETIAPRVVASSAVVLMEGQSRPVLPNNLQVVDADTPVDNIQLLVVGGLLHGNLLVDQEPASSFSYQDLLRRSVVYVHDDSDSRQDHLQLQISDGPHAAMVRLEVLILPKDDSPPVLVTNLGLRVIQRDTLRITPDILSAEDEDGSDVIYTITSPPSFGQICRKLPWEKAGTPVATFTQKDINKGLLYYHHSGNQSTSDQFHVSLTDTSRPPNRSPDSQAVVVTVVPAGGEAPRRDPRSPNTLVVRETEMGVLTEDSLHYLDPDSARLTFTLTSSPHYVGAYTKSGGAGQLVSLEGEPRPPVKRSDYPPLSQFSQEEVMGGRVGYMPPSADIGPYPLTLAVGFSVEDPEGHVLPGQLLNITILPVNNQAPELHLRPLQVEEGSSALVSAAEVSATDPDTLSSDLQLSLFSVPLHGSLRRDGLALRVGDLLSLEDILGHRLEYVHDGSESHSDRIRLGVHDGNHFVDGTLEVEVRPVDDETPRWKEGLLRSVTVEENGSIQITSQMLAATDSDTEDARLTFLLTAPPKHGRLEVAGKAAVRFLQRDVMAGKVYYTHDGLEESQEDGFTVAVLDRPYPDQSSAAQPRHTVAIQVRPRKSHAPVLAPQQQPALLVEEGQSVPLALTVEDKDTADSGLTVMVVSPPHYGRLIGSLPGSEMVTPLSSFPLAEVKHHRIFYHQSHHRNVEPESDNFEVVVTDGQHNSSVARLLVTIILRNDEEPQVSLLELSLLEGGIASLGENVLRVTDADFPADRLVVSVAAPPQHGVISKLVTLEDGSQAELMLESEDLHHFLRTAVYHHDGSENFQDELRLEVTDGLHQRVASTKVTVVPVNDQPPRIIVNRGLSGVAVGGAALISPRFLLAADADRPPDKLVFRVTSPPAAGRLEHRTTDTVWLPLLAPVFSQQQLEDNLVRYIHDGKGAADGFNFTVSDGVHETGVQRFSIEVASAALAFTTSSLLVAEGSSAGLNASHLVLQSFEGPVEDVTVDIVAAPQLGRLERAELPGVAVQSFRFLELAGGAVIYNHTAEDSGGQDVIYFTVRDSVSSRNGSLVVDIMAGQDYPRLVRRRLLQVAANSTAVLSGALLQARDAAVGPESLHYVVAEPPQHGLLLLSGRPLPDGAFTQADLDLHRLHYRHTSGSPGSDSFLFRLVNGRSTGFLVAGRIVTEPARFDIEVEDPGQTTSVLLKSPTELEQVGPNGEPGFVLTSDHIKAVGPHAPNTTYLVRPFQHTQLLLQGSPVPGHFSQADIDARRLSLVILPDDATEDILQFTPVDGAGTHLPPHRLEVRWAVLQFAYQEYEVCEDAGVVDVVVLRAGDLRCSSYAAVTAAGITATEGRDFEPTVPGAAIQLGPGETSATWSLRVVDDGLEEAPVEQLQLTLQAVSGAVLGSQHIASVAIHDRVNGQCPLLPSATGTPISQQDTAVVVAPNLPTVAAAASIPAISQPPPAAAEPRTTAPLHTPTAQQLCEPSILGLLHFDPQSSQLFQCDGSRWKPWPAPSPLLDPTQPCKKGWAAHSGLCHRWFRQPVNWFQAERRCRKHAAHLVAAISSHHSLWLARQLTSHRPFWTGPYTAGPSGSGPRRCPLSRGGEWQQRPCHLPHGYVCAKESWSPQPQ